MLPEGTSVGLRCHPECRRIPTYIAVPVYNKLPTTQAFVAQLRKERGTWDHAILIDNGSTDGTLEWLRSIEGDGLEVWNRENQNVYAIRNEAWRTAIERTHGGPVNFADFNNDVTFLSPGVLTEMAGALRFDDRWFAVAASFPVPNRSPDEALDHAVVCAPRIPGFAFMVKGELAPSRIPFYDEAYDWWCGDTDLWEAIRVAGGRLGYCASAKIHHIAGSSTDPKDPKCVHLMNAATTTDGQRFFKKWGRRWQDPVGMTPGSPSLSVCMIAKDEEDVIGECLESVKSIATEIIVVDTGSTDKTVEIARSFGSQVIRSPWTKNFSQSRNLSIRAATSDWILVIDADETFTYDPDVLREALENPVAFGYEMPLVERDASKSMVVSAPIFRLFRRLPGIFFERRVHEEVLPSFLALKGHDGLQRLGLGHAAIIHSGYSKDRLASKGKISRNRELVELSLKEEPDDLYLWYRYLEILLMEESTSAKQAARKAFGLLRRADSKALAPLTYTGELAAMVAGCLASVGKLKAARAIVRWAERDLKPSARLYYVAGKLAIAESAWPSAEKYLRLSLEACDSLGFIPISTGFVCDVVSSLAGVLVITGRRGEAIALLSKVVETGQADFKCRWALQALLKREAEEAGNGTGVKNAVTLKVTGVDM